MQRIVLVSALAASAAATYPSAQRPQLLAQLDSYTAQVGTDYLPESVVGDQEALLGRLFEANQVIARLSKEQPSATFGLTPMSLLTADEFTALLAKSFKKKAPAPVRALRADTLAAAAATGTVDWTTTKCVNPIKNQGKCGSCWAFSATGAIESAHCIATGVLLDLSEQQVVSCEKEDGQGGCKGGDEAYAIDWIVNTNKGQCLTKDYPYTSGSTKVDGECLTTCKNQVLEVGGMVMKEGEAELEKVIVNQPTTVAVEAGNAEWKHYKSGVLTHCPGAQSDHAVVAVGYGTDDKGVAYYKIRNSWGTTWGEQGYVKLQRGVGGKGMCNVAEEVAFPELKGTPAPTTKPAC